MKKLIIFLAGAATGSAITYTIIKNKFKRIADEEIASVVETFKKRFETTEDDYNKDKERIVNGFVEMCDNLPHETIQKFAEQINTFVSDLGYSVGVDLSNGHDKQVVLPDYEYDIGKGHEENEDEEMPIAPFTIIDDQDFGEEYDTETLYYYSDNILADEDDNEITNPEDLVGTALDNFEKYTESVYVRDELKKIDYEILRSEKLFSEVNYRAEQDDE